jgi:hypothetical protein
MRTRWRAPARPGHQDLDDLGTAKVRATIDQAHTQPIARRGAGDKNRDTLEASEAFAPRDQLVDADLDLFDLGKPRRPRRPWCGRLAIEASIATVRTIRTGTIRTTAIRAPAVWTMAIGTTRAATRTLIATVRTIRTWPVRTRTIGLPTTGVTTVGSSAIGADVGRAGVGRARWSVGTETAAPGLAACALAAPVGTIPFGSTLPWLTAGWTGLIRTARARAAWWPA